MSLVATAGGCVSGADITIGSLIIVADIANNPENEEKLDFKLQVQMDIHIFTASKYETTIN